MLWVNAEGSEASSTTTYEHKARPWEVEFVNTFELNRDRESYEVNGFFNKLDSSFLHSLTSYDQVRLFGTLMYQNIEGTPTKSSLDFIEAMYRRKSILKEQDHFFNLDLELKSYYSTDDDFREMSSQNGAFIPQLVFSKNFTHRFSLESKLRHMFYFKRNNDPTTLDEEFRIYLSPSYYVPPGIIFNTLFTYKHTHRVGDTPRLPQDFDRLKVMPSVMVMLNRSAMLQFYADTEIAKSYDHRLINQHWRDAMTYGAAIYFTLL